MSVASVQLSVQMKHMGRSPSALVPLNWKLATGNFASRYRLRLQLLLALRPSTRLAAGTLTAGSAAFATLLTTAHAWSSVLTTRARRTTRGTILTGHEELIVRAERTGSHRHDRLAFGEALEDFRTLAV